MKRILACILTVTMILALISTSFVYAEGDTYNPYDAPELLNPGKIQVSVNLNGGAVIDYGTDKITNSLVSKEDATSTSEHMSIHTGETTWGDAIPPCEIVLDLGKNVTFSGVRIYSRVWRPWAGNGNMNLHNAQSIFAGYISVSQDGINYFDFEIQDLDEKALCADIYCKKYGQNINMNVRYVKVVPTKAGGKYWCPEEICLIKPDNKLKTYSTVANLGQELQSGVNEAVKGYIESFMTKEKAAGFIKEIDGVANPMENKNAINEIVKRAELASGLEVINLRYSETYPLAEAEILSFNEEGDDEAVISLKDDKIKAVGLGGAVVLVNGVKKIVRVTPSPMALVLLTGQSNAAGDCSDYTMAINAVGKYEDRFFTTNTMNCSMDKEKITLAKAKKEAEVGGKSQLMEAYANTGSALWSGGTMTALGARLSDEWNEPVWILNTGICAQIIERFDPENADNSAYTSTVDYVKKVKEIIENDPHYYLDEEKLGYFWIQGCCNGIDSMSPLGMEEYAERYMNMHNGFEREFGSNYGAIMLVRGSQTNNGAKDFYMSGPRLAQIYLGNSDKEEHKDIYLIMNTDLWKTDGKVATYFENKYPDANAFFERFGYQRPVTHNEVKPNIHYNQVGYNELGDESGLNLAKTFRGETAVHYAEFIDYYGNPLTRITVTVGESDETKVAVPMPTGMSYNASAGLRVEISNPDVARYNPDTFMIEGVSNGKTLATLYYKYTPLATLKINVQGGSGMDTSKGFYDMPSPNYWSYNAICYAVDNGILTGIADGILAPGDNLTRAQMATILVRVKNPQGTADISFFTDVKETAWYVGDLARAYKAGYFKGDGTTFRPNSYITNEEAMTVIARAFNLEGSESSAMCFSDSQNISSWSKASIGALVEAGVIKNSGDLNPKKEITREEFAQIIFMVLSL